MKTEEHLIPYQTTHLTGRRVIVFAPHPDDETIGCGGSIAIHAAAGDAVKVVILTNGAQANMSDNISKEEYIAIRQEEAKQACRILGVHNIEFWQYEDRHLADSEGVLNRMADAIRSFDAELIYIPSPMEFHPDHRAAVFWLEKVIRNSNLSFKIAFYEVNQPLTMVNTVINITEVLNRKTQAIQVYQSQLVDKTFSDIWLSLNRFRTFTLSPDITHAEAFSVWDSDVLKYKGILSIFFDHFAKLSPETGDAIISQSKDLTMQVSSFNPLLGGAGVGHPKVSVIVPTYNRKTFLKDALKSIFAQTYQDFEIIVINNGGEEVGDLIDELNQDEKIVYLKHDHNRGPAAARNTGLKASKGKYIAYLDDDDLYYPNHLETLISVLEQGKYKVAYTDSHERIQSWITDRYVTVYEKVIFSSNFDSEQLLIGNYIPTLNIAHARHIIDETGLFDENLGTHEDWDLWIRFSRKYEFFHIRETTAAYTTKTDRSSIRVGNRRSFYNSLCRIHQRYAHWVDKPQILIAQKQLEARFARQAEMSVTPQDISDEYQSFHCRALIREIGKGKKLLEISESDNIPAGMYDVVSCSVSQTDKITSLVNSIKPILTSNGILAISAKNQPTDELDALLSTCFKYIQLFGQQIYPVSDIFPLNGQSFPLQTLDIEKGEDRFVLSSNDKKKYSSILAVASDETLPEEILKEFYLTDISNTLHRQSEKLIQYLEADIREKDIVSSDLIYQKDSYIKHLEEAISDKNTHIGNLEDTISDKDIRIRNSETTLNDKDAHIRNIEAVIDSKDTHIHNLDGIIEDINSQIHALENTIIDKDAHITTLEGLIRNKDAHIGNLETIIRDKEETIADIGENLSDLQGINYSKDQQIADMTAQRDAYATQLDQTAGQVDLKETHIRNIEAELKIIKASKVWRFAEMLRKFFYFWLLAKFPLLQKSALTLSKEGFRTFLSKAKGYLNRNQLPIVNDLIESDYDIWMKKHALTDEKIRQIQADITRFEYKPKISLIMPVYNVDQIWLEKAIESVINQLYPNWELCMVDDASPKPHIRKTLEKYAKKDKRIKVKYFAQNQGMSVAYNEALKLATGEFAGTLDHDDELTPDALYENVKLLNQNPNLDMIYSDEDKIDIRQRRSDPFFKPDYSPDLLLCMSYICHFTIFRREKLLAVGGFRAGYDGAQDYDIMLRFTEKTDADKIAHIPQILYHWRKIPGSAAMATDAKNYAYISAKKALSDYLDRNKIAGDVSNGHFVGSYRIRRKIVQPDKVSIIVPFKDKVDLLKICVSSIFAKTDYPNYEFLLVNNQSQDSATYEYLDNIRQRRNIRIIEYNKPFDFSDMNNYAVSQADGRYILMLNNDTEVISNEWLSAMVEHGQRKEVGVVGAKLLYPNDTIQHAGVVMGLGIASHAFKYFPLLHNGYFGLASVIRNCSAVTAACMLMRKEVFEELGGLDAENLKIAYSDVDLCLKAVDKGYRVIYTPYAMLYHHESVSRGDDNDEALKRDNPEKYHRVISERGYMTNKWQKYIENDPYYNINLTRERDDFGIRVNG